MKSFFGGRVFTSVITHEEGIPYHQCIKADLKENVLDTANFEVK